MHLLQTGTLGWGQGSSYQSNRDSTACVPTWSTWGSGGHMAPRPSVWTRQYFPKMRLQSKYLHLRTHRGVIHVRSPHLVNVLHEIATAAALRYPLREDAVPYCLHRRAHQDSELAVTEHVPAFILVRGGGPATGAATHQWNALPVSPRNCTAQPRLWLHMYLCFRVGIRETV